MNFRSSGTISTVGVAKRSPPDSAIATRTSPFHSTAQHCDGEVSEQLRHRNRRVAVLAATSEHIAPLSRRQSNFRSAPIRRATPLVQPINQARHDHDDLFLASDTCECAYMIAAVFLGLNRPVIALCEQLGMGSAQIEQPADDEQFLEPVLPTPGEVSHAGASQPRPAIRAASANRPDGDCPGRPD